MSPIRLGTIVRLLPRFHDHRRYRVIKIRTADCVPPKCRHCGEDWLGHLYLNVRCQKCLFEPTTYEPLVLPDSELALRDADSEEEPGEMLTLIRADLVEVVG